MTVPASIPGQIVPSGQQPYSNQQNFGQLIGEVNAYNSGMGAALVQNFINNAARDYFDRRTWYGLMTRGQISTPGYYSTGSIALTLGSSSVQGINTNWTASLGGQPIVGQQLRVGFIATVFTIIGLDPVRQVLTIDLPWALPTASSSGYFITKMYYSIPNIKYIYAMKNLQLMRRMWTNVPQSLLENLDPARLVMLYPKVAATMPPDPNGNYQIELWPSANTQQGLPWLGYVQPPNLVHDDDNLPPYIRADVVKCKAIADVLLYRPKANPNYSEATCVTIAETKNREYEAKLVMAAQADENLYRQDIVTWAEQWPMFDLDGPVGGAMLGAMTATMAGGDDY